MRHPKSKQNQKFLKTCRVILPFLSTSIFILLFSSCAKKEDRVLFRFIDNFNQKNILISPFQEFASDPERFKEQNPSVHEIADEFPLLDSGIGKNPFLLKKKLKVGLVEINTLLAPPRSIYRFTLKIPDKGILELTYGIRRDSEFAQKKEGNRIAEFSVRLDSADEKLTIFQDTLNLNPEESLAFDYKKIDLSDYEGKKVHISFITRGSEKALACWFNPVVYSPQQHTKNVILISLDTLRPDHLGCYGYPRETSPNIDSLSQESALFQNTFATSPWTLPSHVSMLTSLNCINHQVYHIDQTMDPSLLTLADIFRTNDYFTGAITSGGYVSGLYGFSKGFDSYHVRGAILEKNAAELGCRYALEWIERHKDRNFFLFLHTYQIHTPYDSPAPFNTLFLKDDAKFTHIDMGRLRYNHENRYKPVSADIKQNFIDLYDAEIRYTDEALIRPLIERLKKLDIYDDTMVVLTSDHGEEFYEHGSWQHLHSVYNETIKIPLVIKFFNSEHAGKTVTKYTRIIDIMPTILEALNIDLPKQELDGKSLFGLLADEEQENSERIFICELASNVMKKHVPKKMAINRGKHKFILNQDFKPEDLAYFFSPPPEIDPMEVFDLELDPDELKNMALEKPQLAKTLLDFLKTHNTQKRKVFPEKAKINQELREQLRALGYIK
jgi:arylsulfatase A-like enzyme